MIHLERSALPHEADAYLKSLTVRIAAAPPDQRANVAERAWRNKSTIRFREVRDTLLSMCSGIERCMYCEDSASSAIDHYCPKAIEPLLSFVWENYLAACSTCNSNFKRSEYPVDTADWPLLLNPAVDEPAEHLTLSPTTGEYVEVPSSPKAAESIRVFGLNRQTLSRGRQNAWILSELTIVAYDQALSRGDAYEAHLLRRVIAAQPFAGVLRAVISTAQRTDSIGITEACRAAVGRRPEVQRWPAELFGG